jgi:ppGpp synthetase/RelA/SpoT-type nucleotidyltranferase
MASLRAKLRQKKYAKPAQQLTDSIGVRVITYYRDDVDRVADRLKERFEINAEESTDRRRQLDVQEFGYTSVQLIARLKHSEIQAPQYQALGGRWFEVQIRSILEHAWAEIEHEVVYKAGVEYSDEVLRRFAALAAGLELLDGQFLVLRGQRNVLVEGYRDRYRGRLDPRQPFDAARLLGFLEAVRPLGRSWRQAAQEGKPFAAGLERSCVEALKAVGLGTAASLRAMLSSARFRGAVRYFAAAQGIAPAQLSHLAVVVVAVAVKDARHIQQHVPEIVFDPAIAGLVQRRAQR